VKQVESQWLFVKPDKSSVPKTASQPGPEGLIVCNEKIMPAFYRFIFAKSSFICKKIKFIFNKFGNMIMADIYECKYNLLLFFQFLVFEGSRILINLLGKGMRKQFVYSDRLSLTRLYDRGVDGKSGMGCRFYREITACNHDRVCFPGMISDTRFLLAYLMYPDNSSQSGLVFPGQSREFMLHTYFFHMFNHCK
jgi:hypothetical protein